MVFQEPTSSLNPCYPIGWQIGESLRAHHAVERRAVRGRVIDLLSQVGIPAPETRLGAFPHQLSGGMNQRVMIAMALAGQPDLLIADEPTTALDATIQAQILELLAEIRRETHMAMVLISHDLGVVAENTDRVCVMYAGRIVEDAPIDTVFEAPAHPYTRGLLAALPDHGTISFRIAAYQGAPLEGSYALASLNAALKRLAGPCKWSVVAQPGK